MLFRRDENAKEKMTEEDLDRMAVLCGKDGEDSPYIAKAADFAEAVDFLKSDREAMNMFMEMAQLLRDVRDMRNLLGESNEMFREFAEPACQYGIKISGRLIEKTKKRDKVFPAMAALALAYSRRADEKPNGNAEPDRSVE